MRLGQRWGSFLIIALLLSPDLLYAATSYRDTMRFAAEMASGGSWREAKFRWEQAVRDQPDSANAYNNLAVASEALGDYEDAEDYYARAVEISPRNEYILDNQARFAVFWRRLQQLMAERDGREVDNQSLPPLPIATDKTQRKGKVLPVIVALPVPAKLKLRGDEVMLVASFLAQETSLLDINRELVKFMRAEFRKRTAMEVLDIVPPPAVPEQRIEDLIANKEFWKYLHREYGAELIVSGGLDYDRRDASGFEDVDVISPVTGQKVRDTRFVEKEEFVYEVDLFFIEGATGELLHRERLQRGAIYRGAQNDPITAFYDLSEAIAGDVLSVVTERKRRETRAIFKR